MKQKFEKIVKTIVRHAIPIYWILILFVSIGFNVKENKNFSTYPKYDAALYHELAVVISRGENILADGSDIGDIVMPGYSFMISLIYRLFSINPWYILLLQTILITMAHLAFALIMKNIVTLKLAFFSSLWFISYKPTLSYASKLLIESSTISLLLFSIVIIWLFFKRKKYFYLYLFSVISFVLVAFNNRFIAHFLLGYPILFFFMVKHKMKLHSLLISFVLFVLLLLPWHIRQYYVHNKFVLFSPVRTSQAINENSNVYEFLKYTDALKSLEYNSNKLYQKEALKLFTPQNYELLKLKKEKEFHGICQYLSRLKGFFTLYNTQIHFLYGHDIRINPPDISKPILHVSYYYGILLLIVIILVKKGFLSRRYSAIYVVISFLLLLPQFLVSIDIYKLGLMFPFLLFSLFDAIKNKNYFILFLFGYLFTHIAIHTYLHYLPRYRITIVPVLFLLGFQGMQVFFDSNIMFLKNYSHVRK